MTDEKPSPIVRCKQCGWIYPNTPTDKGYHRSNCPYDLKLRIQKLELLLEKKEEAAPILQDVPFDEYDEALGEQVEEVPTAGISTVPDGWDDDEDEDPALTTSANLLR